MDEIAGLRRERSYRLLVPLFFVSGATALVYQTLWARELHHVFGTSTFAIATVLSAFMAGLAIGGFWMGKHADRIARPLRAYGLIEAGIGVYALIFPYLVAMVTPLYLSAWRVLEPSPVVFGLIQFVLVGVTLLIPTALMGATLPLLARFATQRLGAAGDRVGTLYGVNTAGAVFGTALAGFVLLPSLGLWLTTVLAAAANLILAAGALQLSKYSGGGGQVLVVENDLDQQPFSPALLTVTVAIGLAGFASLAYEVAWFRVLGLMLGASTYAFTVMLLAFLSGIAIGGRVGGPMADRVLQNRGPGGVLRALGLIEIGVALTSYLSMYLYPELPYWYVWMFEWLGAETRPEQMWVVSLALSGLIMTPAAVLMGAAFPFAVRAVVGNSEELGRSVGMVYGANTLGGVAGAALAGFVLLPGLHVQGTVFLAAIVNLAAAVVIMVGGGFKDLPLSTSLRYAGLVAAFVLVVVGIGQRPPWNPLLMTAGMYKYVSSVEDKSREGIYSYSVGQYDLLYYEEGLSSVVTVARNTESENIWLANNGKVDASTSIDMPTQVLVSLLPMQFVDDPKHVVVIGLASGITAGAVTLIDDVETLEVVELEPAIIRATEFFEPYNHFLLADARTKIILNDGRNHILLAQPGTYDVIVSEPSNPWLTGVSNLFTHEFLAMGKTRLKPDGVWAQWVQTYGMDTGDLRSLMGTFAAVYDYVLMYATAEGADLILIGADKPLEPSLDRARILFERWRPVADEMRLVDMKRPMDVVALFQLDRDGLLAAWDGMELNTDDNMRIEYSAPLNLHRSTQADNAELIGAHARIPVEVLDDPVFDLVDLARAYRRGDDWRRAFRAIARAASQLEVDDPLRQELVSEAEAWYDEMIDEYGYDELDVTDELRDVSDEMGNL